MVYASSGVTDRLKGIVPCSAELQPSKMMNVVHKIPLLICQIVRGTLYLDRKDVSLEPRRN